MCEDNDVQVPTEIVCDYSDVHVPTEKVCGYRIVQLPTEKVCEDNQIIMIETHGDSVQRKWSSPTQSM